MHPKEQNRTTHLRCQLSYNHGYVLDLCRVTKMHIVEKQNRVGTVEVVVLVNICNAERGTISCDLM